VLPAWQRIDPLAGLARIASWETLVSLCFNTLALVGLVAAAVWSAGPLINFLSVADGSQLAGQAVAGASMTLAPIMGAAALAAVCQWMLAWRKSEQRIRLTPEEFKDELRCLGSDAKVRWQRQASAGRKA
jgi:flagellar biosynthesis protein FlhB